MMHSMKLKVFLRLQEFVQDLAGLRHLRTINIRFVRGTAYPHDSTELKKWLEWAKKILSRVVQNSDDNKEPKKVVLYFSEGVPETHFVDLLEES